MVVPLHPPPARRPRPPHCLLGRPRPRAACPLPCVPLRDGRPLRRPRRQLGLAQRLRRGQYGLGRLATPLEPSKDAPDNADFVDVTFAGTNGAHYVLENALTLYERDGGSSGSTSITRPASRTRAVPASSSSATPSSSATTTTASHGSSARTVRSKWRRR
jgi:hypothetical protein